MVSADFSTGSTWRCVHSGSVFIFIFDTLFQLVGLPVTTQTLEVISRSLLSPHTLSLSLSPLQYIYIYIYIYPQTLWTYYDIPLFLPFLTSRFGYTVALGSVVKCGSRSVETAWCDRWVKPKSHVSRARLTHILELQGAIPPGCNPPWRS